MITRLVVRVLVWGSNLNRRTGWKLSAFNRWIYRRTSGVLGDTVPGAELILLTTTGRRTGRPHTVPVASFRDGDDVIVGAHAGGSPTDPNWVRNLRIHPGAEVQRKRERFAVRATFLDDDERAEVVRRPASPVIDIYERRMERRAPFVRLRRS